MASTSAWPPVPELHRLYAPGGREGGSGAPPPPPPAPPLDSYTAFGVARTLHMEPPQLHAPRLFDPAAEPAAELKRLNVELLVSYTELLSALADGTPGYDAHVHSCGVVLANMQQLLSEQRDAQAADALEHALQQQLSSQRQATLLLRQRAAAARQATAHAAARKA